MTSCGPGRRSRSPPAGPAGAATRRSRPRRARRRGWPSAACAGEEGSVELHLKLLADVGLVGLPERGQVLAAERDDPRAAEDRLLSVHDAAAGAGHDRRRRPPARPGRHPGADRGRLRRRRPRPRLPRARRAHAAARARARPRAAGRLGPGAQLRGDRARAGRARPPAGRPATAAGAEQGRSRDARGGRGGRRRVARARGVPSDRDLERDAPGPGRAARRAAGARAGGRAGARGVRRGRGGRVRGLPPGEVAGVRHHARARTAAGS